MLILYELSSTRHFGRSGSILRSRMIGIKMIVSKIILFDEDFGVQAVISENVISALLTAGA